VPLLSPRLKEKQSPPVWRGILMLLILPYGLMATFSLMMYRAFRKKSKERQQISHTYRAESEREFPKFTGRIEQLHGRGLLAFGNCAQTQFRTLISDA
jgi:hypothetical protein